MALQGSNLGFKTDKIYSMEEVKSCLIDAVLLGLQPTNNEFNIIAKNMYPTRAGFGSLLKKINGLKYSISYSNPTFTPDKSSANCTATIKWELNGESHVQEQEFAIKSNQYATADAILGKAERKARRWLFNTVEGTDIPDGDVTDIGHIDITPKQSVSEVNKNKQYDRVKSHIENELTNSFDVLEKCKSAITESDHDFKEMYVIKAIQLAKTETEIMSIKDWVDPEIDLDIYTQWDDKKRDLKFNKK